MSTVAVRSNHRRSQLADALRGRLLILDGATGTALQAFDLGSEDFGGPDFEGCNEHLCRTRPDIVTRVHKEYLEAGADIVETNSFGGTPLVLSEYGLADDAFELNRLAAALARAACDRFETDDHPRFVCGSMGPTTKSLSLTGGLSFEAMAADYQVQAAGLIAGGADYLVLETCQDLLNTKAGLIGIDGACAESGVVVPVAVTVTIEPGGRMLGGPDVEAMAAALGHRNLLYLGLNCATGPERMRDDLRRLSGLAPVPVACIPNAGLPNADGAYDQDPTTFSSVLEAYADAGWLNVVGGCCGTTADHIRALADRVRACSPRRIPNERRSLISGYDAVELTDSNRPLLIGERTNVLGSRRFKDLIESGRFDEAAEIGRTQVAKGAQVLDVCLQSTDLEEIAMLNGLLDRLVRKVRVPLMIDSTDPDVMEAALRKLQGKGVLNSANLEGGPDRLVRIARLARTFGAAIVVGLIDEDGMAVDLDRKLEVARRCYGLLVDGEGLPPEDLWWDALVFPCGSGDRATLGAALPTLEAVARLKSEFPGTRTILGISNISFGLPAAGREVLNSVFLHRATKQGLDAAIVNTERLARFADLPLEHRALSEALLESNPARPDAAHEAIARFTEVFRVRTPAASAAHDRSTADVAERLAAAVVSGNRSHLEADLDEALRDPRWPDPLDIVSGPLMQGMNEVGRLFNDNELIVAEVLQSAEVMQRAVTILKHHLPDQRPQSRGIVVLATVKGDVHDIGKNLVSIVLANNGFDVRDLGIQVPNDRIVREAIETRPDAIGLSGLLVKSANRMITVAEDLRAAGVEIPLLVGGAALTRRFTRAKIAPAFAGPCFHGKDAMHALDLCNRLTDPERREALLEAERKASNPPPQRDGKPGRPSKRRRRVPAEAPAPKGKPDFDRHHVTLDPDEVWPHLSRQALYGRHLGLKGSIARLERDEDPRWRSLQALIRDLQDEASRGAMTLSAVWRFLPVRKRDRTLEILDPDTGRSAGIWEVPPAPSGGCLTDFINTEDVAAFFVTTAGVGIPDQVERWTAAGEYLRGHALAALAIESAEAAAEWVNRRVRREWGFPESNDNEKRPRGLRFSFGYPGCPELEAQRGLFQWLAPADIGVRLTELDMMDPEASVSGIVVHHPEARYL